MLLNCKVSAYFSDSQTLREISWLIFCRGLIKYTEVSGKAVALVGKAISRNPKGLLYPSSQIAKYPLLTGARLGTKKSSTYDWMKYTLGQRPAQGLEACSSSYKFCNFK